ncbi:MAG TPA: hypothetical protein VJN18_00105 [Polyangiaceae bacterium]|nr:hypothetical protein [Polyangiaceae bacterium]
MAYETETKPKAEASKPERESEPKPEAKPEPEPKPDTSDSEPKPSESAGEAKTSVQQSDEDDGAALDAKGRERPRFLLAFPEHPDLARLITAFEAGNYALVREEAEALAERAENPAVRAAALELRSRIEPDPLVKYLLALTAALLLFLAYFAYHH